MTVAPDEEVAAAPPRIGGKKSPRPKAAPKQERASATPNTAPTPAPVPVPSIVAKVGPEDRPRKRLSLGNEPTPPRGENCNIKDVLAAAEDVQRDGFDEMAASLHAVTMKPKLRDALWELNALQEGFGDNEPIGGSIPPRTY
jgi:type IV secretion system protein VirD4